MPGARALVLCLLVILFCLCLDCSADKKKKKPCKYNGKKYKAREVIDTLEDNCVELKCSKKGKTIELEPIKECAFCKEDMEGIKPSSDIEFALKHIKSGKYLSIEEKKLSFWYKTFFCTKIVDYTFPCVVLSSSFDETMKFAFDIDGGLWGYIRHIKTGTYFSFDSSMYQFEYKDCTGRYPIFLYLVKNPSATHLFKFNQFNNRIINREGDNNIICTDQNQIPQNGTMAVVYKEEDCSEPEFMALNTTDLDKEVLVYGNADVLANWNYVIGEDNPVKVATTHKIEVTIGYNKEESTSTANIFAWEVTLNVKKWFIEMSGSVSQKEEITESSSETWSTEVKKTMVLEVKIGQTVAVWQRVYSATQMGHRLVQDSGIFKQTKNSSIKPSDNAMDAEVYFEETN